MRSSLLWCLGLFLFAFALRAGVIAVGAASASSGFWRRFEVEDSLDYRRVSRRFARIGVLSGEGTRSLNVQGRMPLYPLLLNALEKTGLDNLHPRRAAVWANVILFSFSICFLFLSLQPFLGPLASGLGAGWFALDPITIPYSLILMPESLSVFFALGAIACSVKAARAGSVRWGALAGAAFGAAALTKPIFLFLPGLVTAVLLISKGKGGFRLAAIQLSFYGFMIVPWMVRNQISFGTFTPTPQIGHLLYHTLRLPVARVLRPSFPGGRLDERVWPRARVDSDLAAAPDLLTLSTISGKFAAVDILSSPWMYFKASLAKQIRLFSGTGTVAFAHLLGSHTGAQSGWRNLTPEVWNWLTDSRWGRYQLFCWLIMGVSYGLAAWGLWVGIRYGHRVAMVATFGLLYFVLLYGPSSVSRYRFPVVPAFAALIAVAVRRVTSDGCETGQTELSTALGASCSLSETATPANV